MITGALHSLVLCGLQAGLFNLVEYQSHCLGQILFPFIHQVYHILLLFVLFIFMKQ